jgi:general secretion pathway protein L
MAEQLFVRLVDSVDDVDAVVLSTDGRLLRTETAVPLSAVATLANGRRVSVFTPPGEAVVVAAEIPRVSASRMRSLLPFSLEDSFATDVDELHFAAGRTQADGKVAAAVISRASIEDRLAEVRAAGLEPQSMYAPCDGVPDTPSTTNLVLDGDCILGRQPDQCGFRLEGVDLDTVWGLLEESDPEATALRHVTVYGRADDLAARRTEIDQLRARVPDLETRELRSGPVELLAVTLARGIGTNLLQGRYAPKSNVKAALRPWYAAAALAGALIVITLVNMTSELVRLRQADAALAQQTQSLCSGRFATSQLSACEAEVQRRLASVGQASTAAESSFLSTLRAVAGASDMGTLEAVSYRNDVLDLDMRIPSVAELDAFAQRVASGSPFEVETLSNTPQDQGLRSHVQVLMSQ